MIFLRRWSRWFLTTAISEVKKSFSVSILSQYQQDLFKVLRGNETVNVYNSMTTRQTPPAEGDHHKVDSSMTASEWAGRETVFVNVLFVVLSAFISLPHYTLAIMCLLWLTIEFGSIQLNKIVWIGILSKTRRTSKLFTLYLVLWLLFSSSKNDFNLMSSPNILFLCFCQADILRSLHKVLGEHSHLTVVWSCAAGSLSRRVVMYLSISTVLNWFNGLCTSSGQTGQPHNQRQQFPLSYTEHQCNR